MTRCVSLVKVKVKVVKCSATFVGRVHRWSVLVEYSGTYMHTLTKSRHSTMYWNQEKIIFNFRISISYAPECH